MKRLVLVLDSTPMGLAARSYALALAKIQQTDVLGVTVLDTPWLTAAQPEPLGGSAFKVRRDEEVIRSTQDHLNQLMSDFKAAGDQANISTQVIEAEGFPANEIEVASYQGDVIVLGGLTDLHFELDQTSDILVKHLAHDNPRPLIVVPRVPSMTNVVLMACDGEIRSARALHMFLLLGLGQNKVLHLLNVHKNREQGQRLLQQAVALCHLYQVEVHTHICPETGSVGKTILEQAQNVQAEMIIIGAFGRNLLRETFFGSCSQTVLKNATVPLFIHH